MYDTVTLLLLDIPFNYIFHSLKIISYTSAIVIFYPTFGASSPLLLPSINLRYKIIFYGPNDFNTVT